MASTYSPSLKLELIGNGDQSGVWGTTTNKNLGTLLEQAITGVQSIDMANNEYPLTNFNGTSDEARNAVLVVGGINGAIRKVLAPLVNKTYIVYNNTTGGFAITIGGASGNVVTIPNGVTTLVYCDGVNFYTGLSGTAGNFSINGNATVSGNLAFTGTGNRITGDMSNGTVANRIAFQTSTINSNTDVNAIPNGTGVQSQFSVHNNSDTTNCARGTFLVNATETSIRSNILGTGTYLPLTMYTGGLERLHIDTSGNVGIGTSSPGSYRLNVQSATGLARILSTTGTNGAGLNINNTAGDLWFGRDSSTASTFGLGNYAGVISSEGAYPFIISVNSGERMRITSAGNVGIGTDSPVTKLGVAGAISFIGNISAPAVDAGVYRPADGTLGFVSNGSEQMRIASNGIVTGTAGNLMLVSGTVQNAPFTAPNTYADFTGIPSWVKRITVMFNGISSSGTSFKQIQLIYGGSTVVNSGYASSSTRFNGSTLSESPATTGFVLNSASASDTSSGSFTITNLTGNTWTGFGGMTYSTGGNLFSAGGVTIAGTLTGVRITTVNGTDTFDAGSINILYE